jgi:hypothetical protein
VVRQKPVIVIEEVDVPAACQCDSRVARCGGAPALIVAYERDSITRSDPLSKPIDDSVRSCASIVDDDHLEIGERLSGDALECSREHLGTVERRDDHADERIARPYPRHASDLGRFSRGEGPVDPDADSGVASLEERLRLSAQDEPLRQPTGTEEIARALEQGFRLTPTSLVGPQPGVEVFDRESLEGIRAESDQLVLRRLDVRDLGGERSGPRDDIEGDRDSHHRGCTCEIGTPQARMTSAWKSTAPIPSGCR